MALILAAIVSLIALIITPGWLFYFDVTPKLAVLLAGTALVLVWRPSGRVPRWFSMLLALSLVSLAISGALSSNRALAAFGTNWRRFGVVAQGVILLFAWLVAAHSAGRIRVILRAIALSAVLLSLYGIAQYFGWDPFLPAAAYHIGAGIWTIVRPPGTLGYVSYFANWLLLSIFLCIVLVPLESSRGWRYLAAAAAGLSTIAMLLTGTRAALLGFLVGMCCIGFRVTRRTVAIAALCLVAVTAFYFSPPGWKLRSRARWFVEDPLGGARLALWHDSLRMSAAHLAFGYGPELFTAAFPRFESETLARAYPDFSHESPHNMFLDALVAQGILGVAVLATLCFLGVRRGAAGFFPALAAGLVSQQFVVFTIPTAMLFYVTIALAVAMSSEPVEQPAKVRFSPAMIPIALGLLYLAVRFTLADHALALAQRGIESHDAGAAAAHYAQYERRRLAGTSAALWYSRSLINLMGASPDARTRLQLFPIAAAAALAATCDSEEPFNAWYSLAGVYAMENNAAGAEHSLREAIAANPNWFKPHWSLAQLLRLEGHVGEAAGEAALAVRLNGDKNPEVLSTLEEIRQQSILLQR